MTEQFLSELASEIRSAYPGLTVTVSIDREFADFSSVGIHAGKHFFCISSMEEFEALRAIASIIAGQDADNAMEKSLNEQAAIYDK